MHNFDVNMQFLPFFPPIKIPICEGSQFMLLLRIQFLKRTCCNFLHCTGIMHDHFCLFVATFIIDLNCACFLAVCCMSVEVK